MHQYSTNQMQTPTETQIQLFLLGLIPTVSETIQKTWE